LFASLFAEESPRKKLYFRGTQWSDLKGHHVAQSFSPSLAVALIWSAHPGDAFSSHDALRKARYLPTSTVFAVEIDAKNKLSVEENHLTLGDVCRMLKYGTETGISEDEVLRIYNYLHNRLTGKAKGGEFLYRVVDEDEREISDDDIPFSFQNPQTPISIARERFVYDPSLEEADRVTADTYVFFDAPMMKKVALRLGYDAFVYPDLFEGSRYASKGLLNLDADDLPGVHEDYDLRNDYVLLHDTVRPLDDSIVTIVWQRSAEELVAKLRQVREANLR
jgi:hypothetical protein